MNEPLTNIDRIPEGTAGVDPRLRRIIDQLTRATLTGRIRQVPSPAGCANNPTLTDVCNALENIIDSLQQAGVFTVDFLVDEFDTAVGDESNNQVIG